VDLVLTVANTRVAAADGTGAYTALGQLGAVTVDDGQVRQTWTRGVSSGLLTSQSVMIPGASNPAVYNVAGMTYAGTTLLGYTDAVNQTTHRYWYSATGRLVASQDKDALSLAQKQLTCVGFSTGGYLATGYTLGGQFIPGPSFGNIEVVREGNAAPVTASYPYSSGGSVDTGPSGPDGPTSVGTSSLVYDSFGRVTSKRGGAEGFTYDLAGRLTGVSRVAGDNESIAYDPFGLPVSRTVNGVTTWYIGRDATVTSVGGQLRADVHVTVNGDRVASVRVGANPRTLYLHRDRLTSVVATTLAGGVAGATYRYPAHGALEAVAGDAGDAASELGYTGTLRLTGGLLWMGARVYDPALKIFLQPDPLSPHSYTYADGDPINKWDPTGLLTSLTDFDSNSTFRKNDARFWAGVRSGASGAGGGVVYIEYPPQTIVGTIFRTNNLPPGPPDPPQLPPMNTSFPAPFSPGLAPGDTSLGQSAGPGGGAGGSGAGGISAQRDTSRGWGDRFGDRFSSNFTLTKHTVMSPFTAAWRYVWYGMRINTVDEALTVSAGIATQVAIARSFNAYLAQFGLTATVMAEAALFQGGLGVSGLSVVGAGALGAGIQVGATVGVGFLGIAVGSAIEAGVYATYTSYIGKGG
jgi:RHS repeat-associated protein